MRTVRDLLNNSKPKLRLRDFVGKVCRLVKAHETRGGTKFAEGEEVRITHSWRGAFNIDALDTKSNGARRHLRGIWPLELVLVGDAPSPSYVPPPRPKIITCPVCSKQVGRDVSFRGHCTVAHWIQAHPSKVEDIVYRHFRGKPETEP